VLDQDHGLAAAAAHGRGTLVPGCQQHGFVEGEVDVVVAEHAEDGRAVGGWIRHARLRLLRGRHACSGGKDEEDGGLRFHACAPGLNLKRGMTLSRTCPGWWVAAGMAAGATRPCRPPSVA